MGAGFDLAGFGVVVLGGAQGMVEGGVGGVARITIPGHLIKYLTGRARSSLGF